MNEAEMISLQSYTIGSIGQIIKIAENPKVEFSKEKAYDEIHRIYDGYIKRLNELLVK